MGKKSYLPPPQAHDNGRRWLYLKHVMRKARIEKRSFVRIIIQLLGVLFHYISSYFLSVYTIDFNRRFFMKNKNGSCYYFNGAKLPDLSKDREKTKSLYGIFSDTFLFFCFYNDNYDKETVELLDPYMPEGPYGYTDGSFDVTIKQDDIVIDAGAWIGDFSAYAATKGAEVYAFEPVKMNYDLLLETSKMNNDFGKIVPIKKGLGDNECELPIFIDAKNSGSNTLSQKNAVKKLSSETISITTLDKFVEENGLKKVDFIKADIEGAERDMLKGAVKTLQTFAPKLAICTYHHPDDPKVLENIILEINPNYTVRHLRKKLFAMIMQKA